jgi:hypothetical protein
MPYQNGCKLVLFNSKTFNISAAMICMPAPSEFVSLAINIIKWFSCTPSSSLRPLQLG